ncbi:non-ribosomal peptide synthetase [Amnibacterium kyonggiense]|uniref:Amino acid adenylation domain-containing protein n=1 Tax=Amnibacterium kyonggiense TaxID=595671 RepID=A0A4R7FIQ4_9MICO|nr:non-ribosomal peptide synthetase [Amnibacterium kyonggiense]TDS74918.1 amino acid adenylation domain-containing protein [Amnibacterium kyonggiense]
MLPKIHPDPSSTLPAVSAEADWFAHLQRVAAERGDALALTGPSGSWSYSALMHRIDQIAAWLRDRLPAGDEPVGVMVAHDVDVVLLPLALTRLGRVWTNLDPFAPPARIADIAELSGMTACIVDEAHREMVEELGLPIATIVAAVPDDAPVDPSLLVPERSGQDPLFLVFTSGSTGRPKGVVQTHLQHLNEVHVSVEQWAPGPDDRILLVFPMAFVLGPVTVEAALLTGASLHVHDARTHTPRATIDVIRRERITVLYSSPHLLDAITAELRPDEQLDGLRAALTGGEGITGRQVDAFRAHAPQATFVNGLGSSEAGATAQQIVPPGTPVDPGAMPAGRAVPNRELRIVGDDGEPVATGEVGQLMVVSDSISGGYWRNEEETAKKFGALPDGRRTYLLGDLARLDAQGVLTLQGRSDTAIKVRGYLVDISEIEDALRSNEKVSETVVIPVVVEGAPTRLIAYVAQHSRVRSDSVADLRRRLREKLPEYMVPGSIVLLSALPRNERGKIDRLNLPQPDDAPQDVDDTAWTQHELVVGGIWASVLGLDKVPLDGDFLALGGDSLSVEEMLADVGERFGLELASTDLLGAPTLRAFAEHVRRGSAATKRHPDVVHLRSGAEDRRVFCFAGAGALALQFLPLARRLDGFDVTAFQAHGLERRALPDWTVEAHAHRALEHIRAVQPHGPYRLLGHSFGGLVAFEIAHRLRAEGEEVALLGLIDTFLPDTATNELAVTGQFGRLAQRQPRGVLERLQHVIAPVSESSLQNTSPLRAFVRLARARTAGLIRYRGQQQFDTFFYQSVLAGRRYRAQPYAGRAVVVAARENGIDVDSWQPLLTGRATMVRVDGEHSALMREPHVAQLSATLLPALKDRLEQVLPA